MFSDHLDVYLTISFFNYFFSDPEKVVRPRIPLTTCIKNFAKDDVIDGFYSTALERKSVVRKYVDMFFAEYKGSIGYITE